MPEKAPQPQSTEKNELLQSHELEHIREKLEKELDNNAEKAEASQLNAEKLSAQAKEQAISGAEMSHGETADTQHHPVLVNKQLKEMAYSRSMTRVRKHLSIPSRAFSRAVHSKLLDRPSEVLGNTVARPSGMLGGALFAAVGTSMLLWTTKHYGYEYNYLAVIMLFIIGMFIGLGAELVLKLVRKK